MFEVVNRKDEKIYTVYGVKDSLFLIYNKKLNTWMWVQQSEFKPYIEIY